MDSAKVEKKPKTCERCGCEAEDEELPYDENKIPCKFCERNLKSENVGGDFYSENWVLQLNSGKAKPFFEDPTPRERALLGLLKINVEFWGE